MVAIPCCRYSIPWAVWLIQLLMQTLLQVHILIIMIAARFPQARVLCQARGYMFVELDFDVLKGEAAPELTLFD